MFHAKKLGEQLGEMLINYGRAEECAERDDDAALGWLVIVSREAANIMNNINQEIEYQYRQKDSKREGE